MPYFEEMVQIGWKKIAYIEMVNFKQQCSLEGGFQKFKRKYKLQNKRRTQISSICVKCFTVK